MSAILPFSLAGKRALVTGAAQGIGLTIARGLAVAGAELLLNDLNEERLHATVTSLARRGLGVTPWRFNVANEA